LCAFNLEIQTPNQIELGTNLQFVIRFGIEIQKGKEKRRIKPCWAGNLLFGPFSLLCAAQQWTPWRRHVDPGGTATRPRFTDWRGPLTGLTPRALPAPGWLTCGAVLSTVSHPRACPDLPLPCGALRQCLPARRVAHLGRCRMGPMIGGTHVTGASPS
jgi:hypothetical protein